MFCIGYFMVFRGNMEAIFGKTHIQDGLRHF